MSKHTPGPWEIRAEDNLIHAHGITICRVDNVKHPGIEADAHLIAASPDMLVALKDAKSELLDVLSSIDKERVHYDGDDFHELLNKINVAISKAEGK